MAKVGFAYHLWIPLTDYHTPCRLCGTGDRSEKRKTGTGVLIEGGAGKGTLGTQ